MNIVGKLPTTTSKIVWDSNLVAPSPFKFEGSAGLVGDLTGNVVGNVVGNVDGKLVIPGYTAASSIQLGSVVYTLTPSDVTTHSKYIGGTGVNNGIILTGISLNFVDTYTDVSAKPNFLEFDDSLNWGSVSRSINCSASGTSNLNFQCEVIRELDSTTVFSKYVSNMSSTSFTVDFPSSIDFSSDTFTFRFYSKGGSGMTLNTTLSAYTSSSIGVYA